MLPIESGSAQRLNNVQDSKDTPNANAADLIAQATDSRTGQVDTASSRHG